MARAFVSANPDHIDLGSQGKFNFERTDSWSVSGWVYLNAIGVDYSIIGTFDTGNQFVGWEMDIPSNNDVQLFLISNFGSNNYLYKPSVSNVVVANTWYHLAFTYNGNSDVSGVHIYINGVEPSYAATVNSLSASIKNTIPLRWGARSDGTKAFNGKSGDWLIVSGVLSQSEIYSLYRGDWPDRIRPASILGYWPFDNSGGRLVDLSKYRNHAISTGTTPFPGSPTTQWRFRPALRHVEWALSPPAVAAGKLFRSPNLDALSTGGPFFSNPIG